MDRNNSILIRYILFSVVVTTIISCFNKTQEEENPLEYVDYSPTLNECIGKYYFIPIKDDFRDDYKYLNLNKGDTLFFEIKKDSTFFFNKIYYNQAQKFENLSGKITVNNNKININPDTSKIRIKYIFPRGFKKSPKTGLYYYNAINSPGDSTDFEYYIMYKKMK